MALDSIRNITIPSVPTNDLCEIGIFEDKIRLVFNKIKKIQNRNKHSGELKQTSYKKLNEIIDRIEEFYFEHRLGKGLSEHLIEMRKHIKLYMMMLKTTYKTNSFHFILTMRQGHFKKAKPQVDVVPKFKINPESVTLSLITIDELKMPRQKLHALHKLTEFYNKKINELTEIKNTKVYSKILISKTKESIRRYSDFLKLVRLYIDTKVELDDKLAAIGSIKFVEKSKNIELYTRLYDENGKNQAWKLVISNFHQPEILVEVLNMVLRDRVFKTKKKNPIEYIKDWVKFFRSKSDFQLSKNNCQKVVCELVRLQENEIRDDYFKELIYKCLFSCFDPSGMSRCLAYIRLFRKNKIILAKNLSRVIRSVEVFGSNHISLQKWSEDILVKDKSTFKVPKFNLDTFVSQSKKGKLKEKHLLIAINSFFHLSKSLYLQFPFTEYEKHGADKFIKLHKGISTQVATIIKKIKDKLNECKTKNEKTNLAQTFLKISKALVCRGETNLSLFLFTTFSTFDKLKIYRKLEEIFDTRGNHKNLRKKITKNSKSKKCNIPFFGLVNKELFERYEQLKRYKEIRESELSDYLDIQFDIQQRHNRLKESYYFFKISFEKPKKITKNSLLAIPM